MLQSSFLLCSFVNQTAFGITGCPFRSQDSSTLFTFGHSRPPALTQTPFHFPFRSLQTTCIVPKLLFIFHFGHSRPPALTQTPFHFPFRSLQTTCIDPNSFSFSDFGHSVLEFEKSAALFHKSPCTETRHLLYADAFEHVIVHPKTAGQKIPSI